MAIRRTGHSLVLNNANKLSKRDLRSGVCFRSGRYATAKTNPSTAAPSAGRYTNLIFIQRLSL